MWCQNILQSLGRGVLKIFFKFSILYNYMQCALCPLMSLSTSWHNVSLSKSDVVGKSSEFRPTALSKRSFSAFSAPRLWRSCWCVQKERPGRVEFAFDLWFQPFSNSEMFYAYLFYFIFCSSNFPNLTKALNARLSVFIIVRMTSKFT